MCHYAGRTAEVRSPQPDNANQLQATLTNAKRSATMRARRMGITLVGSDTSPLPSYQRAAAVLATCAPVLLPTALTGATLRDFNVERVRGYLERNLGCSRKEVIKMLALHPRTVAKAIRKIRGGT